MSRARGDLRSAERDRDMIRHSVHDRARLEADLADADGALRTELAFNRAELDAHLKELEGKRVTLQHQTKTAREEHNALMSSLAQVR